MSISLAVSALEAAPAVISGLTSIANSVETDLAGHKPVINTAADALTAASASLQSAPVAAALGSTGEAAIAEGEAAVTTSMTLWQECEALAAKLKAALAKI